MLAGRQESLLVLSDLHLHPQSKERNRQFIAFLEMAQRNNQQIAIAGDLFDLWFGWEHLTFPYQKPILEKMKKVVQDGLVIDYVEGNRDFGIDRYQGIIFRSVSRNYLELEWNGRFVHIEHGDQINKNDIPYRLWRRVTKNRFTLLLPRVLPSSLLLSFSERMEKSLRKTNRKHKSYYPQTLCDAFCADLAFKSIDVLIVGHFHQERETQFHQKNRNMLFYTLPGWENGFRYLVIPSGDRKPYFTEWGKENGNSTAA